MEALFGSIQGLLLSRWGAVLGAVSIFVLVRWRAGSAHSLLSRLWTWVVGRAEAHDPVLQQTLQESRDVEQFRFVFRLKVETLAQMRNLVAWAGQHNLGMAELQGMRNWIDVSSPKVVCPPSRAYLFGYLLSSLFLCVLMAVAAQVASTRDAFFYTRDSKVLFGTDGTQVRSLWGGWSFVPEACNARRNDILQQTGFTENELQALCAGLNGIELAAKVRQAVQLQQALGFLVMLLAFAGALIAYRVVVSGEAARKLHDRLYPSGATGSDPASSVDNM